MRLVPLLVGLLACGLVATVMFPVFEEVKMAAPPTHCLSNLKQSSLGLILYAGDENDRFALRDGWMNGIKPYTKDEGILRCPSVPKSVYGYAFNGALSAAKIPKEPVGVALVYESVNPIRNASDLVTSLPSPGRHHGTNHVAYADGHAKAVAGP